MEKMEDLSKNTWDQIFKDPTREFHEQKVMAGIFYVVIPIVILIVLLVIIEEYFPMNKKVFVIGIITLLILISTNFILFILERKYFSYLKKKRKELHEEESIEIQKVFKKYKHEVIREKESLLLVRKSLTNLNPIHKDLYTDYIAEIMTSKINKIDNLIEKKKNIDN